MLDTLKHYKPTRILDLVAGILRPDAPEFHQETVNAFRPIMRGFLAPAAVYYAIILVMHVRFLSGESLLLMASLASLASLSALGLFRYFRKEGLTIGQLEAWSTYYYLLVFANITAQQMLQLEVPKLVYFVLLAMAVATSGVTLRLILTFVTLSLGTAILLAGQEGPEAQAQFAFISLASAFVAVGMAGLMRFAIKREIRARIKAEKLHNAARRAADFDFLTGLPNRRQFFARLEEAFSDLATGRQLALGLIDLNGFKHVNDTYGHAFGDELLRRVGSRIADVCEAGAFVARLGGDEFAILQERPASDAVLRDLGSRVCAAVAESIEIDGAEINISAAVGFARKVATTSEPSQIYEQADFALYGAKREGGGRVELFTLENERQLDEIKTVEHHLSTSRLEDELFIEFQPQVKVDENKVLGFEALARWQSPQLGRVAPDMFIRAAERCGIMNKITPILLKKALEEAATWPDDVRMSFNLSARDVVSVEAIEQICSVVKQGAFAGDRIDFEITETAIMTDFERVRKSLARLRELGAHIALDDFGVGYSNFQHLDELAIDKLKIDRRFVTHIGTSANSGRIVRTMIDMCNNLGLACVIEGVETSEELNAVLEVGGSIVQGYHFSRPMHGAMVLPFLSNPVTAGQEVRASA